MVAHFLWFVLFDFSPTLGVVFVPNIWLREKKWGGRGFFPVSMRIFRTVSNKFSFPVFR